MLKEKVKLMFALAIVSLMGVSSQAFAQNYTCYDNWTNNAGVQWWNNNIPQEYILSENQTAKINDIRSNSNEKIIPLHNELWALRADFRRYNQKSDTDIKKIEANRSKIRDLENKISSINLKTQLRIKKILGKEQLSYFNEGGYGWWNMDDNCWYSNNNNMQYSNQKMMMHNNRCRGW